MKAVKRMSLSVIMGIAIVALYLAGCSLFGGGSGSISLSLTDAPITDAEDVEGVFITIDSISYHLDDAWIDDTSFSGPQQFNLLELTGGVVAPLSDMVIDAGVVTQIRFNLAVSEDGEAGSADPASYIAIDPDGTADGDPSDDEKHELFIPSGDQTGYKANGPFTVPSNGTVEITADFDIRKSVTLTGGGKYILQPTIRLIVNNQAGEITGSFAYDETDPTYTDYVIFVYADGEWDSTTESTDFPGAVTSSGPADSDDDTVLDTYVLPFLAAGTYDLVVAGVAADGTYTVVDDTSYVDIVVEADSVTTENIDIAPAAE